VAELDVLVVNAGSSSLKLRLLDAGDELVWQRDLDASGGQPAEQELEEALGEVARADASGHRVVHGGPNHADAERVDDKLRRELRELTELAPLHQPPALDALDAVLRARPELPAVACFDTAFHATLPAAARTYALPADWRERLGLRRFGFHGLSHAYASRRAAELAPGARRIVTCHLGAGASLAAVLDGRSVDTTMGFTPLAGLVMATRSGDVDPGLLMWLLEQGEIDAAGLHDALEHRSGLAGLAGTADMREIVDRRGRGDDAATLAFDVYVHRLRAAIAAMAASLGGLDALVFTGGVGEHSAAVRAAATEGLAFLGAGLDTDANEAAADDALIGDGPVRVVVVSAREDLEIARRVREVLAD
jgi:acetate kinase